jgi:hypothetical protein
MFKCTIASKPFITILNIIETVNYTAVFKATNNGLICRIKNGNEMIDLMIPREAFIQY